MNPEILAKMQEHLQSISKENIPVIVEGINDESSLRKLGINKIIRVKSFPIFKIVEHLVDNEEKRVVILTDLDKEGKSLYRKLLHDLSQHGVSVDNRFRHFLFKETELRQIEGILSYMDKM
jgi:5S rRNA maturation endonuclease (ribonuclease M5)